MPFLRIFLAGQRPEQARRFDLTAEQTSIGRGADNTLVIEEEGLSRQHAWLVRTPQGYLVIDNASQNGVWVDGVRVSRMLLRDGVQIRLGAALVTFSDLLAGETAAMDGRAIAIAVAPARAPHQLPLMAPPQTPAPVRVAAPAEPPLVVPIVHGRSRPMIEKPRHPPMRPSSQPAPPRVGSQPAPMRVGSQPPPQQLPQSAPRHHAPPDAAESDVFPMPRQGGSRGAAWTFLILVILGLGAGAWYILRVT